jgi:hypothetical protein
LSHAPPHKSAVAAAISNAGGGFVMTAAALDFKQKDRDCALFV